MTAPQNRFLDPGDHLYDLLDDVLVVCPECRGCARIVCRDLAATDCFSRGTLDRDGLQEVLRPVQTWLRAWLTWGSRWAVRSRRDLSPK